MPGAALLPAALAALVCVSAAPAQSLTDSGRYERVRVTGQGVTEGRTVFRPGGNNILVIPGDGSRAVAR